MDLLDMGSAALKRGDARKALEAFARVLQADPRNARARAGVGECLVRAGDWAGGMAHLRQALELENTLVEPRVLLGLGLRLQGHLEQASSMFDEALGLAPEHVEALYQRGLIAKNTRDPGLARRFFAKARELDASRMDVLMELVHIRRALCDWDGLDVLEAELVQRSLLGARAKDLRATVMYGSMARMLLTHDRDSFDLSSLLVKQVLPQQLPIWPPRRAPHARVRLGYLHSDANRHPTGLNLHHFFELHDRGRFEVFVYSFGKDDGSIYRKSVEEGAEHFVDLAGQSDDAIAKRIARDEIDVLVDLMGLMANHKLGVLWRRPAPVQMTYFADPGPVPGECLDYVIADPVVIPDASRDAGYFGPVIRLPRCYFPAAGQAVSDRPPPASRAALGLPTEGFVFASFNAIHKLTPEMFASWLRILRTCPNAVLWVLAGHKLADTALREKLAQAQIDSSRLILAPFEGDYTRHQARLQAADLMLDTVPWGAHTTCADCLRVGVPVLTLTGENFASRVGDSMNRAVGLPELTTRSLAEYEAKACELYARGTADLKAHLLDARNVCGLFNPVHVVRDLERAYLTAQDAVRQATSVKRKGPRVLPHIDLEPA
jgi:predicted O-linked N-acetylglucosamine transferase (SPINDLY family)